MPAVFLPRGPVMCDVAGLALTPEERDVLCHPLVGGVILFARNYRDPAQLAALTAEIRALRVPRLLVTVDHEGGRVQRFREGFTRLPAMGVFGMLWARDPELAVRRAEQTGYVLAAELRARGVDLSFTPVLDLGYSRSRVVGDRAFHRDPEVVARLAGALVAGLARAGMGAVGKHFPGHGYAEADSHVEIPRDARDFDTIWAADMLPYRGALAAQLTGVMPAHVIYTQIDPQPAGFSRFWLQQVLRGRLGYRGAVFSDDLSMEGATVAGGIVARAGAAHAAGCDMVLVCNRPDLTAELLAGWQPWIAPASHSRVAALGRETRPVPDLACDSAYLAAREGVLALAEEVPA